MGLGKSLQTIAFLHTYHAAFPTQRSLLVVPSNVLANWEREFSQWLPTSQSEHKSSLTFDKVKPFWTTLQTCIDIIPSQHVIAAL